MARSERSRSPRAAREHGWDTRSVWPASTKRALTADERIDRSILLEEIEKVVFGDAVLREEAWDPLAAVYLMGSGLFGVLAREFAPWSQRGAALLARIEGLPLLTRQALAALTGLD